MAEEMAQNPALGSERIPSRRGGKRQGAGRKNERVRILSVYVAWLLAHGVRPTLRNVYLYGSTSFQSAFKHRNTGRHSAAAKIWAWLSAFRGIILYSGQSIWGKRLVRFSEVANVV